MSKLIYGKDETANVVAVEVGNDTATLFIEGPEGITTDVMDHERWILHQDLPLVGKTGQLADTRSYKYFSKHETKTAYFEALKRTQWGTYFTYRDDDLNFMVKSGVTCFKDTRLEDVSALAFDIETNSLRKDDSSQVFLISNTFRRNGQVERKLFRVDEYAGQREMIAEWCKWVREKDPTFLIGHNVFGFDLPYLEHCSVSGLRLGRDGSRIRTEKRTSHFRKDGSQSYEFNNMHVYGREIIDTFFLSIKYDVGRKYPSYKLKEIIEYEGLTRESREIVDASNIRVDWYIADNREKICRYCVGDADDALSLHDLMSPSFFYYTRSVPMRFQHVITSATGKQVNSIMLRSYLQDGRSIPEPSHKVDYEGAISFGNPGLYKHVNKVDVASMYPSTILELELYNRGKDPDGHFLKMVQFFTSERLDNKRLAKETGDRYYHDVEQAQKIVINSAYGFLGAPGLHFNSPRDAARITKRGREILTTGMEWVEANGYSLVNVDTDSFSYSTGSKITLDEFVTQIDSINGLFSDLIRWENDGQYKAILVAKAKNYVMVNYDGSRIVKGSSLKATMKEPALRRFISEGIDLIIKGRKDQLYDLYMSYVGAINNLTDIEDWCSKKTVTEAVLNAKRTNEQRVLDALEGTHVQEGDKVFMFFDTPTSLCLREKFSGAYDKPTLLKKLHSTLIVFEHLTDTDLFPNFKLGRNVTRLEVKNEDVIDCPVIKLDSVKRKPLRAVRDSKSKGNKGIPANCTRISPRITNKKSPDTTTTERD